VILNLAARGCYRDPDVCHQRLDSGAWGTAYFYDIPDTSRADSIKLDSSRASIPNKNIFIYNNIFINTSDSATASSHFSIAGPFAAHAFNASCPKPAYADDELAIRGNIIWNGKPNKAIGITSSSGCPASNATCNQKQLERDNLINAAEPEFVNAAAGNFHPKPGSVVYTLAKSFAVPDFSWAGLPPSPVEPAGNISNNVPVDRDSIRRNPSYPICGAFVISTSSVEGQSAAQEEVSLLQNYPNPANGLTTIAFTLLHGTRVTLEVFNLLGEKITTLASSMMDEGDHFVNWNTSHLPSGKYFYRLATGSVTVTKQMTVIN